MFHVPKPVRTQAQIPRCCLARLCEPSSGRWPLSDVQQGLLRCSMHLEAYGCLSLESVCAQR